MFFLDIPPAPTAEAPVLVAQANYGVGRDVVMQDLTPHTGTGATPQPDYIFKDCQETESTGDPRSAMRSVDPAGLLAVYIGNRDHRVIYSNPAALASIKTTLLQGTTHGKIFAGVDNTGRTSYHYDPTPNYEGNDKAVFMAEFEGKRYKIIVELQVMTTVFESDDQTTSICPPPELIKVNGKPVSGSLDNGINTGAMDNSAYTLGSITITFGVLAGGAIGQTAGTNITLDTNASGNGWFIDTTPADNSEYLPTSNPNEWVAKAGSDAYGKMDMLSVLLHEYGHALGIEHSADGHDFMGTTLTPGVRRLPTADELALMGQLISQAKDGLASSNPQDNAPTPFPTLPLSGLGLSFIGFLRSSRYGGVSIVPDPSTLVTQYDIAANATFTNLDTAAGWNTQGSVDINPSTSSGRTATATLNEVSGSQTRLNQVFILNEQDRYLSFTLSGAALDNLTGAPDDAFEVALLDANTGASVLGSDGLTRTDAFLNLQADGTQHTASCVTCINNADGSRTYRVDLTGVAKNTAVNLSFDLIGFGQNGSHVTLSDIRTSGLPQLHDDAATLAEDNLLTFDPYTQADSQLKPLLASHIVDAPTHGALAVNTDGTFSYTPDLNYFGSDSFSYRLSDGGLDSNLATVSLTVTPVNDAPVVADVQATTAEDTALAIALGAYATDVDSTTLTTQIVTGPAYGVLVQNNDGTYSYTPEANYNGADSFTYKANDGALDSNIATVSLNVTPVNDAPTLGDLNLAAVEDTVLPMNLLTAASDVDSTTLSAAIVAGAQHGQVNINADGSFTYTPDANYNGADSFTYRVNDGALDSNVSTVNLSIAAVNDAPVAADAAVTTATQTCIRFILY